MGTSTILIRGEAEGPIIGIEEIRNSNNRQPSPDTIGGFVALDANGEIIQPTIIYFGRFDGGGDNLNAPRLRPMFLMPFEVKFIKYGLMYEGKKDEENISFNIHTDYYLSSHQDLRGVIPHGTIVEKRKMKCVNFPNEESFNSCSSVSLSFVFSHPDIERIGITIALQIFNPDYNEDYLPQGFNI